MGGRVALEVMRRIPDRVLALALLDTGYQPRLPGEAGEREAAGRFALLAKARREGMRAMGHEWLQGMVHPDRLADGDLVNVILDMIEQKTPDLYEAHIRALLARPDATPVLSSIHCPTLVLCGREDSWAPAKRHEDMCAMISGSTLAIVPDCGHMSTLERPAAVSKALREWLSASPAKQGYPT
jgi:pimeloyl-ACP methyl ester carboxylesterase